MTGKVYLIGAGPSDVGLLTIKGKEILQKAQVVVYDRLVGAGILALIPEEAEVIDVGKRAGNHTMPQEKINQLLLEKAQQGKQVVRLKGGDPFLFGRGGEELELLLEHDIPFEIIPGVTSAISVPAYNGIPVTHRDYTSSVHIITGHKKQGERLELDFEALVRLKGTLVFLMGVFALSDICKGLIDAGMESDMPAAVLQQGTTAGQKKIIATVATLSQEVKKQGIQTPAIIVVGKVCALGNSLGWYEKKPLFGKKILVTRPKERSGTLSGKLREAGAEVVEMPAIKTVSIPNNKRLEEELPHLNEYQYLAFTSPAGVNVFFDTLRQQGKDIRSIGTAKIASIGAGTRRELEQRGLFCDLIPEIYDGEHLGILLGETAQKGEKILIPRAKEGNQQLLSEIAKRTEAEITDLPIYETVYEPARFLPEHIDMAVFTSASTVRGFAQAVNQQSLQEAQPVHTEKQQSLQEVQPVHAKMQTGKFMDISKIQAVCIGKQTQAAAKELGMNTITAREATIDSLVECCIEYVRKSGNETLKS